MNVRTVLPLRDVASKADAVQDRVQRLIQVYFGKFSKEGSKQQPTSGSEVVSKYAKERQSGAGQLDG